MSAIVPGLRPAVPAQNQTPDAARAAQAAFFRAAMGAAAPAQTQVQAQALAQTPAPTPTQPASEAPRQGRPGALLDIRV